MIESQGKIQNLKRLQQIPVFENLRFKSSDGSINSIQSPTDIDACFEFQGKIVIYTDYKLVGKDLEIGQYKSFIPQINAMQNGGYLGAYILIAEHSTLLDYPTYDGASCNVVKIYHKHKWTIPTLSLTVKDAYLRIFKKHSIALKGYESPDYLKMLEDII